MRLLMLSICLLAVACLAAATPVKKISNSNPGIKGVPSRRYQDQDAPELNLRKGEYVCNGKVCRLEPVDPGKPPGGCVECQYPIKLFRKSN